MKSLLSLVLVFCLTGVACAIPPGFRLTPLRPHVGPVPRGVPARNFSPRFQQRQLNQFHFQRSFGYNVGAAFVPSYGVQAAFVPAYAPAFAAGGCANYFQQAASVYAPQAAFVPAYAPAFAAGGCGAYFGY